jgi:hypothetical protein
VKFQGLIDREAVKTVISGRDALKDDQRRSSAKGDSSTVSSFLFLALTSLLFSSKESCLLTVLLSFPSFLAIDLTLVSLVSVDYISASERRGKKTSFGGIMDEFYELYLDI